MWQSKSCKYFWWIQTVIWKNIKFKHNDMEDLERILTNIKNDKGKLIVVDRYLVWKEIYAIFWNSKIKQNITQNNGRWCIQWVYLEKWQRHAEPLTWNDVDVIMGTFNKSFASIGGFVAANESYTLFKTPFTCSYFSASIILLLLLFLLH